MDYKVFERGIKIDGMHYEIVGVVAGDNNVIDQWLRNNMKTGDTCQWIYSKTKTKQYSHEEMLVEWQKQDNHDKGVDSV